MTSDTIDSTKRYVVPKKIAEFMGYSTTYTQKRSYDFVIKAVLRKFKYMYSVWNKHNPENITIDQKTKDAFDLKEAVGEIISLQIIKNRIKDELLKLDNNKKVRKIHINKSSKSKTNDADLDLDELSEEEDEEENENVKKLQKKDVDGKNKIIYI